jgi:hypothetical protein
LTQTSRSPCLRGKRWWSEVWEAGLLKTRPWPGSTAALAKARMLPATGNRKSAAGLGRA